MEVFNYADEQERQRVNDGFKRTGIVCVYATIPLSQQTEELKEALKDDKYGFLAMEKQRDFDYRYSPKHLDWHIEDRLVEITKGLDNE